MVTAAQPQSASACRSRQLARQAHCALTSGVTEAKGTRRIDMKLNVLRGRDRDRWGKKEEEERWKNSESQSKGREAKERLRWWKPLYIK